MTARRALMLCSLGLVSCAAPPAGTQRIWLETYALGAIAPADLDLRDYCPNGAPHELSVGSTWETLGISLLTLGVYTPREVRIRCGCEP